MMHTHFPSSKADSSLVVRIAAVLLLLDQDIWILSLQIAIINKFEDISNATSKELGTETRLAKPRSNGPSNNAERLDDAVQVVVVREIGDRRARVEGRGRERPLGERSGSGRDVRP